MKAELQFFAMPNDVEEILALVQSKLDAVEYKHRFIMGDCEVAYKAGILKENILLMGSVVIDTGTVANSCAAQERAKSVYRMVRKWIKTHYSNRLNTYQLTGDRKDKAARNHWISPAAAVWKNLDEQHELKIIENSSTAFDIMKVSNLIGEIVPVSSNKVRGHG